MVGYKRVFAVLLIPKIICRGGQITMTFYYFFLWGIEWVVLFPKIIVTIRKEVSRERLTGSFFDNERNRSEYKLTHPKKILIRYKLR